MALRPLYIYKESIGNRKEKGRILEKNLPAFSLHFATLCRISPHLKKTIGLKHLILQTQSIKV